MRKPMFVVVVVGNPYTTLIDACASNVETHVFLYVA